eukprot:CAMPEP_0204563562 /NCGR_PEP_ID=MMETSP0661-20131031/34382_1 /ASSEMBLY_ACC=CAM_ASM_000606 /TAXON_ID=109239 /ORGANISM="Alexandrium margalefi, Strain AMGDE01CS-322" /LENGTH=441 /DNA_ID=CAMNT_0051571129 /DNA_START=26 /DNA_END=1351 /DNA_ORIENTATION=+
MGAVLAFASEASQRQYFEICCEAWELGADVNARTTFGDTVLHMACVSNAAPLVDMLLEQTAARIDLKSGDGKLPEELCEQEAVQRTFKEKRHICNDFAVYQDAEKGTLTDFVSDGLVKQQVPCGIGFVASRDLQPGTLLLLEHALVKGSLKQLPQRLETLLEQTPSLQSKVSELFPRLGNINAHQVCAKNAFSLPNYERDAHLLDHDDDDNASSALYHRGSFFNHSCRPNCLWTVVGNMIMVRANTHIRSGEECSVAYMDITLPYPRRQVQLGLLGFQCSCPRCLEELDSAGASLSSMLSPDSTSIAAARKLLHKGSPADAAAVLVQLQPKCQHKASDLGICPLTFDVLQLLFCCYVDLKKATDAHAVAARLLALLRPFRFRAPQYLWLMIKMHPEKLLGTKGADLMKDWLQDVREVSRRQNGGGLNIVFHMFYKDFVLRR